MIEPQLSSKDVAKCLNISYRQALLLMKSNEIPSFIISVSNGRNNSQKEHRYTYPSIVEHYQKQKIRDAINQIDKRKTGRTKLHLNSNGLDSRSIKDFIKEELS